MGKRGPQPTDTATLAARGSWLVAARHKKARLAAQNTKKERSPSWKDLTPAELKKIIKEIPGYDPYRDCGETHFDAKRANNALRFFETKLKHIEGAVAGRYFHLERWQQSVVANLFGWIRENGKRRYRESLIYVPRKNGKTPWMAGIALYVLLEDAEAGQQNFIAAASREQAGKLFRYAKLMVNASQDLSARCRVYGGTAQGGQSKSIVKLPDESSFLQVIAADGGVTHGGTSNLVIVDELHAQPNRELMDVLQTSLTSENRPQPLMICITTADFARESICNEKHDYAKKVRDGIIPNASFLPVIYESIDEDWTAEETWRKCNPNLGISVSLDQLRLECKRAQETPTYENTFKRLHLNIKTQNDVRWIPMDKWEAVNPPSPVFQREKMIIAMNGKPCTAGLDLSTSLDITAFVLSFNFSEKTIWLPYFWIPGDNAEKRERRDRVPYLTWARQGFIKMTAGDVIDYDTVRSDINELGKQFDIQKIGFDPWNASQIVNQLTGDGFEMLAFRQGFSSLSGPSKELEKLVLAGTLDHGGNPVMRWMASNAAAETDAAGNIKPSKAKSTERIDGIVAGVMALGVAMAEPPKPKSVYETRGVLTL